MAIVGSIFALLGRFAGRLLNSALGWATILLFGKVEGRKQTVLLVIALGSVAWVLALVGIVVPDIGTIASLVVPFDEWETVYRERLQVERDLLQKRVEGRPHAVVASPAPMTRKPGTRTTAGPWSWLAAGVGVGLLALDVALLISARLGRPRRGGWRPGWLAKSSGAE